MRKLLILLAVMVCAFAVSAGITSYSAVDGVYDWGTDTLYVSASRYDTISTTADTITVCTKRTFSKLKEHGILFSAFSGTVNFASALPGYVQVIAYDADKTEIYRATVDSIVGSAGEVCDLNIGALVHGSYFTVRVFCTADPGTVAFNKFYAVWRQGTTITLPKR